MARAIRGKPRTPFPYVLEADRSLPAEEQPRWILRPPKRREWADITDNASGRNGILIDAVVQCVERLENHAVEKDFGAPGSKERVAFVDDMDMTVIYEIGNAVAETLLAETDQKN